MAGPIRPNHSTLGFQFVPGEWSGYSFLVLGLLPPKSFGASIPPGYPLLSLPEESVHLKALVNLYIRDLGKISEKGSVVIETIVPFYKSVIYN